MAENSEISWCHHTCNLWMGCTHVHEGCDNCYAEALARRWGNDLWGIDKPRKIVKSVWNDFRRYQKLAAAAGEVHRVFVGSLMDIAEKEMPLVTGKNEPFSIDGKLMHTGYLRNLFFNSIVPNSPNLLFLLLTKRPSNFNKIIPESWKASPPANVMFGTSVVNQPTFNTLVPQLLKVRGRRFLSVEPMLGPIDAGGSDLSGIDWLIVGGESGPKRRPFNTDWARSLKVDCAYQHVPFHFKQVDKVLPIPDDLLIRQFPA